MAISWENVHLNIQYFIIYFPFWEDKKYPPFTAGKYMKIRKEGIVIESYVRRILVCSDRYAPLLQSIRQALLIPVLRHS